MGDHILLIIYGWSYMVDHIWLIIYGWSYGWSYMGDHIWTYRIWLYRIWLYRIWVLIYGCSYMNTNHMWCSYMNIPYMIVPYMIVPYMITIYDLVVLSYTGRIWSYTVTYDCTVYDSYVRIWWSYMNITVYEFIYEHAYTWDADILRMCDYSIRIWRLTAYGFDKKNTIYGCRPYFIRTCQLE